MFFQVLFHALISSNTWHTTLEFAALLVLPALGGVISERSGVVNIAMEGMMLTGAFASVIITLALYKIGVNDALSVILGVLAAILAGGLMALIHAGVSINFKANQIVSGIAINIIALGLTSYLVFVLTPAGQGVPSLPGTLRLPTLPLDQLGNISFLGPILSHVVFQQSIIFCLALVLLFGVQFLLFRTNIGLRTRSGGMNPQTTESISTNMRLVRYLCMFSSGLLAGVVGIFLALGIAGIFNLGPVLFQQNIVFFIALVLLLVPLFLLFRANVGLRTRASDQYPQVANNVLLMPYFYVFSIGLLFALGGAFLTLSNVLQLPNKPFLGPVLFEQNIIFYVALLILIGTQFLLFRTNIGLRIRAVGEHPQAADTAGVNVRLLRYLCVITSGLFSGLAGAYLALGVAGIFNPGMTNGRGFIALAAMIFGKYTPLGAAAACLIFGLGDGLSIPLQDLSNSPNLTNLLNTLPYLFTLIALVGLVGRTTPPAADGVPYEPGSE